MFSLPRRAGGDGGGGPFGRGASRGWAAVEGFGVGDCWSAIAGPVPVPVPAPVPLLFRRRRRRGGSGSGRTGSGAVDVWRVARRAVVTGEPEANGAAVAVAVAVAAPTAPELVVEVPAPVPGPPRCRFRFRVAIPWMRSEKGGVLLSSRIVDVDGSNRLGPSIGKLFVAMTNNHLECNLVAATIPPGELWGAGFRCCWFSSDGG